MARENRLGLPVVWHDGHTLFGAAPALGSRALGGMVSRASREQTTAPGGQLHGRELCRARRSVDRLDGFRRYRSRRSQWAADWRAAADKRVTVDSEHCRADSCVTK